jgi:hypothetical protein
MWSISWILQLTGVDRYPGKFRVPILIFFSALISLTPLGGISLTGYILSINPVFSVGSTCLLLAIVWKRFGGTSYLSKLDLLLFATWNIAVSLYLYISHLGFIGYDLYRYGYGFSLLFVLTACLTVLLALSKSPIAWIFISYILAYDLRLLHSDNFFDYITDGVLFIISVVILVSYIVQSIISRPGTDTVVSGS